MEAKKVEKNNKLWLKILWIFLLADFLIWIAVFQIFHRGKLYVEFFDVGQGDAALIVVPTGQEILIDGGPNSLILERLGKALPFWDRDIDLVILTHPDHDHIAGLLDVLKNYHVKNILWTCVDKDGYEFREWQRLISEEKAEIFCVESGQVVKFDSNQNHNLQVLYPYNSLSGNFVKDANDTSIVLKLNFEERSFLFAGDILEDVEEKLAAETDLKSDVLKFPHHGSQYSASESFVAKIMPAAAVISLGKNNRYNHPSVAALELLEKYGIKIFRTDLNGNVVFETDGRALILRPAD